MKRSKKVGLLLMAPLTTLMLTGCSEEPVDALVFNNAEECAASGQLSKEQCKADYEQAKKVNASVAPKYADKNACEVDFGVGKCETAPAQAGSQSSFFMPMMMGYMMGQMFNRQGAVQQPFSANSATKTSSNFAPQPLYKSKDDSRTFRTAGNVPVTISSGLVRIRPSNLQPKAASLTRRGGFGAQAAARQSSSYSRTGG
jgi:uncharacterized protein YgiB involved in biofilm formation